MSALICPDCGHDVSDHFLNWGYEEYVCDNRGCICQNSEVVITRKAQRAAAIAHLCELRRNRDNTARGTTWHDMANDAIKNSVDAYRAVGILREPRK